MTSLHYRPLQQLQDIPSDGHVILLFDDSLRYHGINDLEGDQLENLVELLRPALFSGKLGEICTLPGQAAKLPWQTIICAGLGNLESFDLCKGLQLGGLIGKHYRKHQISHAYLLPPEKTFHPEQQLAQACQISKGFWLGCYDFTELKTKNTKNTTYTLSLYHSDITTWNTAITTSYHEALGQCFAKDLMHLPPNILYPEAFCEKISELSDLGLEIDILDEHELEHQRMFALLAVGQGSSRPPRLAVMRWAGKNLDTQPIVLVGKGICYDSGGINLKLSMQVDMKYDMGGAAAVVGAMKSIALNKVEQSVVGIVALAENMPDGNAYRPSDIISSRGGLSINILNTDAEGRLALADALDYAITEYNPKAIIDLATLTGAMLVSLGHVYSGFFSHHDKLAQALSQAGSDASEKVWRMPLDPSYDKMIDSPIADVANLGQPAAAGSITAAQFLSRFVDKKIPWAHIDIAGTAWIPSPSSLHDKGPTGFGVSLLLSFLRADKAGRQYV